MSKKKGFTLLELLIVIAILAVLGALVIFLLNPAETLRKARDSQRISDLSTIKTALGIYIASKTSPSLDGQSGSSINEKCIGGTGADTIWITDSAVTDTAASGTALTVATTSAANLALTNGGGWLPVNLDSLTGGSPISNMPVDPINAANDVANIASSSLMYRYACKKSPLGFEVNVRLESGAFGPGGEDDRAAKDGGNNATLYEVGTDLTILPSAGDF
jgi:prepilin-type N-terminal cleavage/methylation domain-containing protein